MMIETERMNQNIIFFCNDSKRNVFETNSKKVLLGSDVLLDVVSQANFHIFC